jgi:hypothetical protein
MNKHNRFQLISPIIGNKIYQSSSFNKGAKKCYDELKGCGKNDFNDFTIMNLDNYETFKFAINKREKHNHNLQQGGNIQNIPTEHISQHNDIKPEHNDIKPEHNDTSTDIKINKIMEIIRILNKKISSIDAKIDNIINDKEEPDAENVTKQTDVVPTENKLNI